MAPSKIFDGSKARELREDAGIEIAELVEALGVNPKTGKHWHRDTISNVELGHHQPSLKLSHAWAAALNVTRSDLMTEAVEPDPSS